MISRAGDRITWTHFRDLTGFYDGPLADEPPPADYGMPLQLPDLSFDASRYLAEVERATTDRWWETPPMAAARLLEREFRRESGRLAALGWHRPWVVAGDQPGTFQMCMYDGHGYQIGLDLAVQPGSPAEQARRLAWLILDTSPLDWIITHCSLCEHTFKPSPGHSQAQHDAQVARHPAHAPATAPL